MERPKCYQKPETVDTTIKCHSCSFIKECIPVARDRDYVLYMGGGQVYPALSDSIQGQLLWDLLFRLAECVPERYLREFLVWVKSKPYGKFTFEAQNGEIKLVRPEKIIKEGDR